MHANRTGISRRTCLLGALALAAIPSTTVAAAAQTPDASNRIDFPGRIGALLAATPAGTIDRHRTFFYADLAGQLETAGVARPDPQRLTRDVPEGFVQATVALPLASRAFTSGFDPRWYPTFGFAPAALGQALMLEDEGALAFFRGGFDPDAVRDALAASGYAATPRDQGDVFDLDDPNLESTAGRLTLGSMHHALVRDDMLVFAGEASRIEDVIAVLAGDATSMASEDRWTGLAALFSPDVVGMIPVPADTLAFWSGGATPTAQPASLVEMAIGVRGGSRSVPLSLGGEGTPSATPVGLAPVPAHVEARLRYADAETAAREAEGIPERWRGGESQITEESFSALMELVEARVSPVDSRAVALDFVTDTPNRWSQIIFADDLSPFIPATE